MPRKYWIIGGIALAVVALIVVGLVLVLVVKPPLPGFLARPTPSPEERLARLEPLPPLVADRSPQAGVELATDGAMVIFFDQPMDQTATINAFSIEPPVAGSFNWLDGETLQFTPAEPLARAAEYTVSIGAGAQSAGGLPVREPIELVFQTVGFLEVSQVVPAPDSTGVEPLSVITVMFNRPVVPLLIAEEQAGLPQPLKLDPPVSGTGEWLNTSIYQFTPDKPLAGGQTYRARVEAGLEDTTGGLMVDGYAWQFVTLPPSVIEVSPEADAVDVGLDQDIRITFNQPMDLASVQGALSVQSEGVVIGGQYRWDEEDDKTLIFTPSPRLALNTHYRIHLDQSARSVSGEVGLDRSYDWEFRTVFAPAIVGTTPTHGQTRADPTERFRLQFASPMDEDTLDNKVIFSPAPPEDFEWYYSDYDRSLNFYFALEPSTDYTVQVLPGMADPYGNIIGRGQTIEFTTDRAQPEIWLNVPGQIGLYDAGRDTELFAVFRNVSVLDFNLYRLDMDTFGQWTGPDGFRFQEEFAPSEDSLLRSWSVPVQGELDEYTFIKQPLADEAGGALSPGVYLLEVDSPDVDQQFRTRHVMVVATANLTLKVGDDEGLVWLTDLDSGQPIAGKRVQFYNENFFPSGEGQTDAEGVLHIDLPPVGFLSETRYAVVDEGGTFAVAHSNWEEGLQGYQFGVPTTYAPTLATAYLYTDRPLYRPGQPMWFKGIVRNVDDVTYSLPTGQNVPVRIYNPQGDLIYEQQLPLSEFGSFDGGITLDEEAALGYHRIEADVGGETYGVGFQVAEYRKPEFQVTLTPAEPEVAQGDPVRVEGQASYFFGGPVSEAEVTWTAVLGGYFFDYSGPGRWQFDDINEDEGFIEDEFIPGYGRVVTEGTTTTDAQGRFVIEFPADLGEQITSGTFTVEAVVTETEEQVVANRTEVVVHAGDFYVGLQPERYIGEAGAGQTVNIVTVDWDSEPLGQQALTVEVVERRWSSVREEDEFGRRVWTFSVEEIPVDSFDVRTDRQGRASVTFTPPNGGTFRVRAVGRDEGGRQVSASAFVWVSGREFVPWRQQNNDRIDLIADRDSYAPGDTAEILITSPFQGEVQALVTVERGNILQKEVITLSSNSTVYRLPITGSLAPNVYVSVVLVKGVDSTNPVPGFKMGLVELEVEPTEQTLNVEVTPDREQVGPGEEVSYNILVTDHEGNPVSAEVSLSLADLAVLSLAAPNSGPILDHFYGNASLGVRTSLALTLSVDRLNQELFDLGKGGGGGGEEGFFEVRGDFRDTAFWRANVVTDERGRASVTISLPDNLTTWRMDARAVSKDTLVGDATVDIVATKDLLVRPVTPRFMVVGDEVRLGVIVHNNTDRDIDGVRVELEAEGVELAASSEARQRVDIGAGGQAEVFWNATALDVETVDLTFSAQGGGLSDASKPTLGIPPDQLLPVYRFEAPEIVGTAGTLTDATTRVEAIVLPRSFEVTQGELSVELDPSLAASMTDGLDYLEHFTYECTEQTVSRFLPNVLTARALRELGIDDPQLEANLDETVNQGLQRLYGQQHVDGGWGWWVQDQSSPTVSAWVVLGMVEAQNSGYAVSPDALGRGIQFLRGELQPLDSLSESTDLNRQAFLLYVLAKAGQPDVSRTVQLYDVRQSLHHYARAYVAQTLWMIDPTDSRVNNVLSDLNNAAIASATGVHWQEEERDFWNWNTDTRSTAIILDTFAVIDPDNQLNPNIVRWLMAARQGGHWETTQETAWSLIALTDWMAATGELDADYAFDVALNGEELASGQANRDTLREPTTLQVDVSQLARRQANQLAVTRGTGPGNLYYTAHLKVGLPVEQIEALSRGVILSRQYYLADDPERPIDSARAGDEIMVRLNIIAPYDLHYVIIEDPIPAGTEAVDTSLLTTSILEERPTLDYADPLAQGWGWWLFSQTQLRDEKVVLSATYLPAGTYEYTYTLRAGLPGEYRVMPPVGYEFYTPEVYGRGEGSLFTVSSG